MIRIGHLDTGVDSDKVAVKAFAMIDRKGDLLPETQPADGEGHGTATAEEILRVIPQAELFSAAVVHGGHVILRILRGMQWLLAQKVHVICIPLGLQAPNPIFDNMIEAMRTNGILPVAAIGNDGAGKARTPALHPRVLAVGAADADGRVKKSSGSWGTKPDVIAISEGGTSLACAHVAGIAARLFDALPKVTDNDVEAAIKATCLPLSPDQDHRAAAGLICPEAAFEWLHNHSACPPAPVANASHYRDPRLLRALARARDDDPVDALLVTRDQPFMQMRAPAKEMLALIQDEKVLVASAPDIDLWTFSDSRGKHNDFR